VFGQELSITGRAHHIAASITRHYVAERSKRSRGIPGVLILNQLQGDAVKTGSCPAKPIKALERAIDVNNTKITFITTLVPTKALSKPQIH